ncbi:MAG: hypothetical protein GOU97_00535 [Nanoarchaeota archaeon]|nr:hypothetical protein [Nanoarchaeota archaeon]
MTNSWFPLYHFYSQKKGFDRKAVERFKQDLARAKNLGVGNVMIEGYYKNLQMGDYTNYYDLKTVKAFVQEAQNHGMKVYPYFCAVELYAKNKVFREHAKDWSAKNFLGKPYRGFISFYLPEYFSGVNSFSQIMCPKSGWSAHLSRDVDKVISDLDADGIYLDRVDYRLTCHDKNHDHSSENFNDSLSFLIKDLKKIGPLFMNDSCIKPDDYFKKYFSHADTVLNEMLPQDSNWFVFNFFKNNLGSFIWRTRKLSEPILKAIYESRFFIKNKGYINFSRYEEVMNRLKKVVGDKEIHVASHRKDYSALKVLKRVLNELGAKVCFIPGMSDLSFVEKFFSTEKQ